MNLNKRIPIRVRDGKTLNRQQYTILKTMFEMGVLTKTSTTELNQIFARFPQDHRIYASLQILEKRGLLTRTKEGRLAYWSLGPLCDDLIDRGILK